MQCNFSYTTFFKEVTKFQPFPFQERFAKRNRNQSIFCEIPTGLGKTYMVLMDWLWGRLNGDKLTPRRLVFVLPLRTLVEQVYADVEKTLKKAGMSERIAVYLLMGGAVELDFDEDPTKECVLIGTLDQILSRQLMRAYSCNRARFPKQFAYLHNDCRIICDETQLMGAGFLTSAVLQSFRDQKGVFGNTQTIWMSATLDRSRLNEHQLFNDAPVLSLEAEDWEDKELIKRLGRAKELKKAETIWRGYESGGVKAFAQSLQQEVIKAHQPGTLTLIILNTTAKAIELYGLLLEALPDEPIELLHSRFRPPDRAKRVAAITDQAFTGIIVSTQCVEAGVDLDARILFTELAPWASVVQRFGRCGRRGTYPEAFIYWIDVEAKDEKDLRPYTQQELDASRARLVKLLHAGIQELLKVEAPKQPVEGERLGENLFRELFDTTPRKNKQERDIAPYVRKVDALDVSVAWRDWKGNSPSDEWEIHRDELCNVAFRQFVQSEIQECWIWNESENQWRETTPKDCKPGQTILLPCSAGGYDEKVGWTGRACNIPNPINTPKIKRETQSTDYQSFNRQWITLRQHSLDAAEAMRNLLAQLQDLDIPFDLQSLLIRTAQWHDLGKAHPVFQQTIRQSGCPNPKEFWAKSPGGGRHSRSGFRHELVSALVALQHGEPELLAYLVACHHGKIRASIDPLPWEEKLPNVARSTRGVVEGDRVPSVDLGLETIVDECNLSLPPAYGQNSWEDIVRFARNESGLGDFRLVFLETLVRNADEIASDPTRTTLEPADSD